MINNHPKEPSNEFQTALKQDLFKEDANLSPKLNKRMRWSLAHGHKVDIKGNDLLVGILTDDEETGLYTAWFNVSSISSNYFMQFLGY